MGFSGLRMSRVSVSMQGSPLRGHTNQYRRGLIHLKENSGQFCSLSHAVSCGLHKVVQFHCFQWKRAAAGNRLAFSEAHNVYQNLEWTGLLAQPALKYLTVCPLANFSGPQSDGAYCINGWNSPLRGLPPNLTIYSYWHLINYATIDSAIQFLVVRGLKSQLVVSLSEQKVARLIPISVGKTNNFPCALSLNRGM